MVWLILGAGLLAGVVLLVLVSWPALRRLRPLRLAADRSRVRADEAQALQVKMEALQASIEALQSRVEATALSRKQS